VIEYAICQREVTCGIAFQIEARVEFAYYLVDWPERGNALGVVPRETRHKNPAGSLLQRFVHGQGHHGGGDSMTAHVGQVKGEMAFTQPEAAEDIASNPPGRLEQRSYFDSWGQVRFTRQQVALHIGGSAQIVSDSSVRFRFVSQRRLQAPITLLERSLQRDDPESGSNARSQLRRVERLFHVVVRPRIEARDDVVVGVLASEQNEVHVGGGSDGSQSPAELDAVNPRHAPVADHEMRGERRHQRQRLQTVGGARHFEARFSQCFLEPGSLRIAVFDNENPLSEPATHGFRNVSRSSPMGTGGKQLCHGALPKMVCGGRSKKNASSVQARDSAERRDHDAVDESRSRNFSRKMQINWQCFAICGNLIYPVRGLPRHRDSLSKHKVS
jgi:hypothetical protein